jgi:hypothetical protein
MALNLVVHGVGESISAAVKAPKNPRRQDVFMDAKMLLIWNCRS